MAELDNLYIKIQAEAVKANDAIDRLDNKLERLEIALEKISKVNLSGFVNSISNLSKSVTSVKTTGFSKLAENINKLSNLDASKLSHIPGALNEMVVALNKVAAVSDNAQNIGLLAANISKLGNKTATNAIANIPQLTKALESLIITLSKAPQVNQSVIDMTNALANLASQGSKVGSASKTIVSGLNRTNTAMARTTKQATSLASAFGKFYASYFLIVRGVKGLWGAIEDSMDYVETYNYFNVALGEIGKDTAARFGEFGEESAEAYAKEFGDKLNELNKKMTGYIVDDEGALQLAGDMGLGLNIQQMMNFQAKVLSVTNSVGLMGEASTSTAKAVSMLAGDLSSLTNVDIESVMGSLTSGLIGQSRALYKYGIDITNNTLQQYAYAEGIEKAVSEMTQSEKMQLRLLAILDQSEVAWGDLGRTVDSVANQYRVLQQQVKNLGRTFGSLFLPIVQNVLPYVNGLVIALNNLFTSLGFSLYGETWLSDLQDGISGGIQDDVGELEDGLEDADTAAKKLKKSLSSFDELEVISISGVSSAADAKGVIDLTASIADALTDYENKWNEAFENAENRASDFAKAISDAFYNIDEGHITSLGGALSALASGIATLGATTAITKAASNLSLLFGVITANPALTAITVLGALTGAIVTWYTTYERMDFTKIDQATAEMESSLGNLESVFSDFSYTIDEIQRKQSSVEDAINSYYELLDNPNIDFKDKKNQLEEYVNYIVKEFPQMATYVDSHTGLFTANRNEILSNIDALADYARTMATQGMLTEAYKELYNARKEYTEFTDEYEKFLKEYEEKYTTKDIHTGALIAMTTTPGYKDATKRLNELRELNEEYKNTISEHESYIARIESGNIDFLGAVTEQSKEEIKDVTYEYEETFATAEEKIEAFSWGIEVLSKDTTELTEKFGAFGKVLENIKANTINTLSEAIDNLNKKEINIPISSGKFFPAEFRSIGAYSVGGFPEDGLFMANHRELVGKFSNGKTAVANNEQIVEGIKQGVYEAVVSAMGATRSDGGDVVVNMDGREVFRVVRSRANEYYNTNGKSAFNF